MFKISLHIYIEGYESKIQRIPQGHQTGHYKMGVSAYGRKWKGLQMKLDWDNILLYLLEHFYSTWLFSSCGSSSPLGHKLSRVEFRNGIIRDSRLWNESPTLGSILALQEPQLPPFWVWRSKCSRNRSQGQSVSSVSGAGLKLKGRWGICFVGLSCGHLKQAFTGFGPGTPATQHEEHIS